LAIYQLPLRELQGLEELKQVEIRLREVCHGEDKWTLLFSSVLQGGKRLRPALVVLCGSFLPAPRSELVDVAAAAELIHAASLVHDDIIDHADSRRGQPTISKRWGEQRAVLYGDFLFAQAFTLLTNHGHTGILGNMTRAISLMCQGEIEQFNLRYDCRLSETDYMSYIHRKTAFFLSACCLSGAEVCGLSSLQQKSLAAFGLQLGYAFQLTDDILDFRGNTSDTGKPVLHDLAEGYLTLPVIRLLRNNHHGPTVRQIIESRNFTADNLAYIKMALESTGILREVDQKARMIIQRAKQNLARLPNKPPRATLTSLANHILQRTC